MRTVSVFTTSLFLIIGTCVGVSDTNTWAGDSFKTRNKLKESKFISHGVLSPHEWNHDITVDNIADIADDSLISPNNGTGSTTGPPPDSNTACQSVRHQNASEKCQFVRTTDDCQIDQGFINYMEVAYCSFSTKLFPLAMVILIIWWLILFISLAVTADDFFCPSLVVIARTMRMSDNIAGVTLLAFGNGAPDVFSAIAAIGSMKDGDAGLAVGALIGAGVFVTTVVAGSVAVVKPFHAMERPFLRDIIFYLAGLYMTFYVFYNNIIQVYQAVAFIGLYVFYVIVVIVGRYIYNKIKNTNSQEQNRGAISHTSSQYGAIGEQPNTGIIAQNPATPAYTPAVTLENEGGTPANEYDRDGGTDGATELTSLIRMGESDGHISSQLKAFIRAVSPIDIHGWSEMKWFMKVYEVLKVLPQFVLNITVPIVDYKEPMHNWNRYLNTIHCVTAPIVILFWASHQGAIYKINGVFPVWALVLMVGVLISVIVFLTSRNDMQPKYHPVFAYVGFITAVLWISTIANEIVNILQMFGIVFNISNAVLGLTLLAWGNSLGDLVADITMARQGMPRTGISACFGGPLFNLLLGIGIPFSIKTIQGGPVSLDFTAIQALLVIALGISLLSSLIILPLIKFRIGKCYGIYLYALYCVFIILAILVEAKVIRF